jgi:hypothetical protein
MTEWPTLENAPDEHQRKARRDESIDAFEREGDGRAEPEPANGSGLCRAHTLCSQDKSSAKSNAGLS